ncbi:MAG: anhydro-N-acetylmuramic acid kinase [Woeseiaceae bacterium]|jgi:anhydro-N-acetylmuramic acid kinase
MPDLYIGLMSGTSMDGIDAALVSFGDNVVDIVATHEHHYPKGLKRDLLAARDNAALKRCEDVPDLHRSVGECFRDAAIELLARADVDRSSVTAIGSHGQTLRHEPDAEQPYSLQIGDPDIIAATGITTVADFRRADIELGGQGAPLAPAFHEWLFREKDALRVVLNIGGIANVTVLPAGGGETTGFDTGPGNTLLDAWAREHLREQFDRSGAWGATGTVQDDLLRQMLADPYFHKPPPKSTGFEYFNMEWLRRFTVSAIAPADVQATLCALTTTSIARAIQSTAGGNCDVFVCGGGVHNADLMQRLGAELPDCEVQTTTVAGLDPDWVEAVAFAWLAMRTSQGLTGNLPSVTGAKGAAVLGSIHQGS